MMLEEAGVDVLGLRGAPLPRLLETLHRAVTAEAPGEVTSAIAELAVDATVRLVRRGSRSELLEGTEALARVLGGPRGATARAQNAGAYDTLSGLLPVLSAAASPAGRDGSSLVLRSWSGKARRALEQIASTSHGVIARGELRRRLDLSESHLSHMLSDLEEASLLERIAVPGRRSVEVHITSTGLELVAAKPSRSNPARTPRLREVCPVAGELGRRAEADRRMGARAGLRRLAGT